MLTPEFIKAQDLSDDATYAAFTRQVVEQFGQSTVACALGVSLPTVDRWMRGVTAPHEAMREPIRRFALRTITGGW